MGNAGRPVLRLDVYNTSSVAFGGVAHTTTTSYTMGVKCWQFDKVGTWIDVTAEGNSNNTFDLEFQTSEDSTNGVDGNWAAMRRGNTASQTAASMTQMTTTGTFESPLFDIPTSDSGYVRMKIAFTGTTKSFTIADWKWRFRAMPVSA